ncbi:uncharacterized protein LOC132201089 [Neocloeon triangulifer]|uniref:uncharacterized protein LOC132201089 n=1 Tax=Neocloeon triangulifer TaxID=2078957 RepID=UPI00286F50AE|nr:uncharacterized protein LOC132201089 [Neocloeon triangulifer]
MQLFVYSACVLLLVLSASGQTPRAFKSTLGNNCYIRNVLAHPNDYLEFTPGQSRAATSLKKGGIKEIDESGQWKIDKWVVNGRTFFEFNNRMDQKYLSHGTNFATGQVGLLATRASYQNTKDLRNLWEISPPKTNAIVTIKHARTGGYLFAPKGDLKKRFVQLGSRPNSGTEYKWFITCN